MTDCSVKSKPVKGTVVIPAFNEAERIVGCIEDVRKKLGPDWNIVVVDGGSADQTMTLLATQPVIRLSSDRGRALQMNAAMSVLQGSLTLFLHADTCLPDDAAEELTAFMATSALWGRFDVTVSPSDSCLRCIAWFMNHRSRLTGMATGDQAMFVRTTLFRQLQGFAPIALMEDIELSRRLLAFGRPYCSKKRVQTSSRKWKQEGVCRTVCLMWAIRLAYFLGVSPDRLHRFYYRF